MHLQANPISTDTSRIAALGGSEEQREAIHSMSETKVQQGQLPHGTEPALHACQISALSAGGAQGTGGDVIGGHDLLHHQALHHVVVPVAICRRAIGQGRPDAEHDGRDDCENHAIQLRVKDMTLSFFDVSLAVRAAAAGVVASLAFLLWLSSSGWGSDVGFGGSVTLALPLT